MRKLLLMILLLVPFLTVPAYAEEYSVSLGEELDVYSLRDTLPEEAREIGGELRLDGAYDSAGALERLWYRLLEYLTDNLRQSAREVLSVLTVAMLCTLGGMLTMKQQQSEYIELAGCAAISCMLAGGMNSLVGQAVSALQTLSDYAKAALPVIYSAAAASGAPASASARYAAACLALDLMMTAAQRLILPLLYAYLAMAVCGSLYDNPLLRGCLKLSHKAAVWLLNGMTVVFTGFLSLTGLVSGSTDAAAIKLTKAVVSAAVPVVGKIMSDAASSVLAAASVVRNTAGAFGLVAVCALCLSPFAAFAVKQLLFSLAAAAAEAMAGGRIARLMEDLSAAMGMLLSLVASFGMMLFFAVVSAIRTVTG